MRRWGPAVLLWALATGSAGAAEPPAGADTGDFPTAIAEPPNRPAEADAEAPVAVTTKVSPDPSNIGDRLELELLAAFPKGYAVNLPSVLSFAPLHLVSVQESEPESTGDGFRKRFTIVLQHFAVGPAEVPSFPLTYVTPEGAVQTLTVPAQAFTVEAVLANENDPQKRPEDPPISIAYPNDLAEIIIYSVLGTLAAAALGWLLARRFLGRRKVVPAPPPIPPHEVAFAALDELERGDLLEQGRFQTYYLQLTEIAKGYLEGRFGIDALDRTTEELRQLLVRRADAIAPLTPTEVIAFLQRCDLVKFARFEPDPAEAREASHDVRTMVESTIPRAVPEPEEPKASEASP